MNFYSMTDTQILAMPVYRFWGLEAQIDRVRSEKDLRLINVHRSVTGKEEMKEIVHRLTLELGDKCKVEHVQMVKPEPGANAKFLKLMNQR
jgi:hypothetical protein